ncbi:hypothetical protein AB1Y20_010852 [Prymnesium parvum]|uniref:Glutathione transferase n=1 Tax=Prymnesium parvum TaxID=97485 RepID=A0AB34ISN9_PRYPA
MDPTSLPEDASPEDVLAFWFGPADADTASRAYLTSRMPRWFGGADLMFDIAQRGMRPLIARVARAELAEPAWHTPRGLLAQILVLDQINRSAHRGTAAAFAHDAAACRLARRLAEGGGFETLAPVHRFFVCIALSHSEQLADSELHVALAARLGDATGYFASLDGFPHEHYETVARFGRFPHRNALLGRPSTPEEAAWLASPSCPAWARSHARAALHYFDGRGLADPIRFLLEFCLVPYEEPTVTTRADFDALRASGRLAFGQVPLLELDGTPLVQTQAILRYVAAKKGLAGGGAAEAAAADMVVNGVLDARMALIVAPFSETPAAALAAFFGARLPRLAAHLEAIFARHAGPYACGASLTYADVVLLECLTYAADVYDGELRQLLREYPRVLAHHARMRSFDHMKEFLQSERRKPPPDAAYVRRTCEILGRPCPAYAQARAPMASRRLWAVGAAAAAAAGAMAWIAMRKK